jgi:metallo-beta-lactamase family protein
MTHITFHGAAQTVTGSKYLLETDGARVLVDCGLFQGLKELRQKNWEPLPIDVSAIDAVVLTHAHLDHVGYLPRLVKDGFGGRVWCTEATAKLARLILLDSAENQERDAQSANKHGFSKHKPALPLYDTRDAEESLQLLHAVEREKWFAPGGPLRMRFHDAGHLLGSSLIEVEDASHNPPLRIVFSGDVGRYNGPLYHDPHPPPACDFLICESTYGDRDHPETDLLDSLADVVNRSIARGGVMLIASFAVGRAQQLIYLLQVLKHQRRIPDLPIYLDSPMSIDATTVYRAHREDHDLSEGQLAGRDTVLAGSKCHFARTVDESKALNAFHGPGVIISSSGMMEGGRILHHLKRRLPDERNTVVLGGFMAVGTRGRHLQDGVKFLRIHGHDVRVRAVIEKVSGLSCHADRGELLKWLKPLTDPRRVFLTHGEPEPAHAFAAQLRETRGWTCHVPQLGERHELG